ncbi:unnamed protein product [Closterium sp. NIES-64]|nr:unnamed protein product [Closterium sp. NIES-64]
MHTQCSHQSCSHMLPFPPLSTPSSDISNNSFYGPINSNFRSMIPDNGALLNIAGNFFYGDPMLYADGCQFCPSQITQSHRLDRGELFFPGESRCALRFMQGYITDIAQAAEKRGQASLQENCFTLNKQMECTANETLRSSDECLAFCSMSRELGPCDGHGACVPPQAGAAEARFTCECDDGFVTTNGTLGSTCARPAPPPAAALSTGAVVGIAVGSAAAFALLLALIVALLWPRQRRRWSDLDVCQEFSMGEILRATDNWASSNVLGKGGFATVYKGVSSKGELWAVKRIALMSNDFETEVRAMASLRHENVVRLLGFCLHQNVESGQQEQILVYEFVPNGDLNKLCCLQVKLSALSPPCPSVAWSASRNSLSFKKRNSSLSSFLVRSLPFSAQNPPNQNRWSSFGVVLLELLTRQKAAVEGTDSHISDWAARRVAVYSMGHFTIIPCYIPPLTPQAARKVQVYELGELKDAGLEAPDEAVVELADIALDCLKMPASRRPNMKDVARRLQNLLSLYCGDADSHSSLAEPSLKMEGRGVRGDGGSSTDTFGRSEWSEGANGTSASRSLVHSLSEKWRMIE